MKHVQHAPLGVLPRIASYVPEPEDFQPWRCVECGEAVNKTTKRDCRCTRALQKAP